MPKEEYPIRRSGDKFDTILQAAVRVFAQYGYHDAQVSRIAREAEVADGTIYLYFESKAALLISVFREHMGRFVEAVRERLACFSNAEDQLRELIYLHFRHLAENRDLAIVTQVELRQSNREIREEIGRILKEYLTLIDGIIQRGKEQGVFRAEIPVHVARKAVFGAMDETVTSWVMTHFKHDLVQLAEPLFDCIVSGFKKR